MSVLAGLHHVTRYRYDRPVGLGPQIVRLRPGAALPHARSELLAQGHARPAFRELAAGSARQLARALRVSREDHRFSVTVDLLADMSVINPFDFFVEPYADEFSVRLSEPSCARSSRPIWRGAGGAAACGISRSRSRASRATSSTSSSSSISGCSSDIRYLVRMEPGVQTPEETLTRRRARAATRLAAGAGPPASRPRGALRVRLSDPAHARPEVARRARRHRRTTSPICTPGPKSICPAPAGSGSIPTSGLLCGEGHMPLAATPHYRARRADQRRRRGGRGRVLVRDEGRRASTKSRASRFRFPTKPGQRSMRWASRSMPISSRRMSASPWAASRPSCRSTITSRRNGTRPRSARPSASSADQLIRRLRDRFAPGGLAALRAGQMVSGRAAAALGVLAVLARRTASRSGSNAALIATEKLAKAAAGRRRARVHRAASPSRLGIAARPRAAGLRGSRRAAC